MTDERPELFARALELHRAGRLGEAIALYERVLALDDSVAEVHNNLGVALADLGEIERAIAHYDRAIELSPMNGAVYDNRGSALQKRGAYAEAIPYHERAVALDPDLAAAHNNLGNALLQMRRPQEALIPIERALALRPNFPEALNAMGGVKQTSGALDEAVAFFHRAVTLAPTYANAYCNLGNALREAGDIAGAQAAYARAVELSPRTGRFHRLLVDASSGRESQDHFRQMLVLAEESEALSIDDRIELHFALGKACEDRGDYARAFDHFRDANALARTVVAYDESATLRAMQPPATITSDLMQALAGIGDPSTVPVFVFGMPRSGTTLVEQILAAHPSVHAAGELGVYVKQHEVGFFEAALTSFTGVSSKDLENLGARYARYVESLAPDAARVTDKWPWNFKFAGIIRLALPNAKLVHVKRDPLDTCFSCFATVFSGDLPYKHDLGELGRYYRSYQRLMDHWRSVLPPGAMLEMTYEDLIADFEMEARRLVEYCGLEWDEACSNFWRARRRVRTASSVQVRQPLYDRAVGRAQPFHEYLAPLRAELDA